MHCRNCKSQELTNVVDLGFAPFSNRFLTSNELGVMEPYYPLQVVVCNCCWLAQTTFTPASEDIFDEDYPYFSSISSSWLAHAKKFANRMIKDLTLTEDSKVLEIASNDGYLLKNFKEAKIPCIGIEPTKSTAKVAKSIGIKTIEKFFSESLSKSLVSTEGQFDLIIANNVFAHIPDLNDFSLGLAKSLKPHGTITIEFQHLLELLKHNQFDTIYHEHYSYLSLISASKILTSLGLRVYRVEKLPTHGGSLRLFICHEKNQLEEHSSVGCFLEEEKQFGLKNPLFLQKHQKNALTIKYNLLKFLIDMKKQKKTVVGYGAAAKGNSLLNFAGVKKDLIQFVVDGAKSKQGKFLPGSHIPVFAPERLIEARPDVILILPWNIADEIVETNSDLSKQGSSFFVAVPELKKL